MRYHKNYVKLLGKMDFRKEAWKTSRPMFTEESLNFDKVAEMDLSLNSMLVYTFEMRSSVIMRDLIFSLRPMEGWALSTRSMPINRDTLRLAEEFRHRDDQYAKVQTMFDRLEAGESRDKIRGILPCSLSSTYTFTIDFRVLMSFCKTIEKLDRDLFDTYCIPMLIATDNFDAYDSTSIRSCEQYYLITDDERINDTKVVGNMAIGHYKMKMALASQFLRQHYSKIKIGLWNIIQDTYYMSLDIDQNYLVDVVFYIDRNSYHKLMAMRSHWVIDHSYDMWGKPVGDYIANMSAKEFWEFTPAGGGKQDPYFADAYNRILLEDPGVPCPIMTEWYGAIAERRKEVGDNQILDKYEELFAEGFIKDNPNNEHRQKYFRLLEENGGSNSGYTKESKDEI